MPVLYLIINLSSAAPVLISVPSGVLADCQQLEQRVMEVLWEAQPLTVRDVKQRLGKKPAYTTVMTTLDRLYKKGLLAREKDGLAFVYRPALDRAEYQRRVVEAALYYGLDALRLGDVAPRYESAGAAS